MAENKTEKPTAQRLRKAREEGQFLSSRGILSAAQFLAFVAVAGPLAPAWGARLERSMSALFARALTGEIGAPEWPALVRGLFIETLMPLAVLGAILLCATLAAHLGMTRLGFSLGRLTPQFNRLNPLTRLRELPGQNLKALLEAALLLGALTLVMRSFLESHLTMLLRLPLQGVPAAAREMGEAIESLLWKAAALFVLFGAFDLVRQYRKYMSSLRMTKQEVREEGKRNEGDPQIKQRIRRLRRELLRRQMMRQVATATAVIVNPTHFAVAIRYEMDSMPSPVVVAKGKNWLALRMRQLATQSEVPIIENPPLARALYDAAEVGSAISPEFYKAIAEILAYVYRLMGRRLPG
ncbi:MAG TPA: EscU/YscU/HrcU family type III secretion system export apparatus switch protein [Bryobacteraceae bacterium]